jgi:hypothetical protein
LVVGNRECLGEEIARDQLASQMHDGEVSLADSVAEPVKAHANALGFAHLDGVGGQADGKFVVAQNRCG